MALFFNHQLTYDKQEKLQERTTEKAAAYCNQGKYQQAVDVLEEILPRVPYMAERVYRLLAPIYFEYLEDWNNALRCYQELPWKKCSTKEQMTTGVRIGICFYYLERYEEAMTQFQELEGKKEISSLVWIGYLYEQGKGVAQDHAKAMEYYIRGLKEKNEDGVRFVTELALYRAELFVQAYTALEEMERMGWNIAENAVKTLMERATDYHLRQIMIMRLDEEDVFNEFNFTLMKELGKRGEATIYHSLGRAWKILRNNDEQSIYWLKKSVEKNDDAISLYHLSFFGEKIDRIPWLERAAEKGHKPSLLRLAYTLHGIGRWDEAEEKYQQLGKMDYRPALQYQIFFYYQKKNPLRNEAISDQYLERLLATEDMNLILKAGKYFLPKRRKDAGVKCLEWCDERGNEEGLIELFRYYRDNGQEMEAFSCMTKMVSSDHVPKGMNYEIAMFMWKGAKFLGDDTVALNYFMQAVKKKEEEVVEGELFLDYADFLMHCNTKEFRNYGLACSLLMKEEAAEYVDTDELLAEARARLEYSMILEEKWTSLARHYHEGSLLEKDPVGAFVCLMRGILKADVQKGREYVKLHLSNMEVNYLVGRNICRWGRDLKKEERYLRPVAEQGHPMAIQELITNLKKQGETEEAQRWEQQKYSLTEQFYDKEYEEIEKDVLAYHACLGDLISIKILASVMLLMIRNSWKENDQRGVAMKQTGLEIFMNYCQELRRYDYRPELIVLQAELLEELSGKPDVEKTMEDELKWAAQHGNVEALSWCADIAGHQEGNYYMALHFLEMAAACGHKASLDGANRNIEANSSYTSLGEEDLKQSKKAYDDMVGEVDMEDIYQKEVYKMFSLQLKPGDIELFEENACIHPNRWRYLYDAEALSEELLRLRQKYGAGFPWE